MISVCIPVYRYDVRPLVYELLRQVEKIAAGKVEILVYDDASPDDPVWGKYELRRIEGIRYVELSRNVGRAAIRNRMIAAARNDYVLLLDADGAPPDNFLQAYLVALENARLKGVAVVVGGRKYDPQVPAVPYRLHWYYGIMREAKPAAERNLRPHLGFQSNNFLVQRAVALAVPFSERVAGYGHEDTLWGQELAAAGHAIWHVDNPVTHLGLEMISEFLRKQKRAVKNLHVLKSRHPHLRTRLLDLVERYPLLTKQARLLPEKQLRRLLTLGENPPLYLLDLLKLRWYTEGD